MKIGMTVAAALAAIWMGGSAQAGFTVCNDTAWTQSVSIGYKAGDEWVSEGWWNIEQSACATIIGGDLKNRYYYYRAEVDGGDFDGEGYYFCTTPSEYTIYGDEGCNQRGFDRESFREVDTGSTATDYTLTLIP